MELTKLLDEVKDEQTFLEFVKELTKDRLEEDKSNKIDQFGRGKHGWENHNIESFLEAAIAWAEDTDFGKTQDIDSNTWKKFATFLYFGKIYE